MKNHTPKKGENEKPHSEKGQNGKHTPKKVSERKNTLLYDRLIMKNHAPKTGQNEKPHS